jgi:prevent-host-death family protein
MNVSASEFKAKCLALIDRVHDEGEPLVITKRGKVVARLVPAGEGEPNPWLRLEGTVRWHGDPFAPAIDADETGASR